MSRKRLGEMLMEAGVLSQRQLQSALEEQKRWGGQLGKILVEQRAISESVLVKVLGTQLNFPTVDISGIRISKELTGLVPRNLAEQNNLLPFRRDGQFLDVAMSDPLRTGILDELRIRTKLNVRPYLAGPRSLARAINLAYGVSMDVEIVDIDQSEVFTTAGEYYQDMLMGDAETRARREPATPPGQKTTPEHGAEVAALQQRLARLEALVARNEDVIRKLFGLLINKSVATREEILEAIK